jgi:predicted TIM-barrel enzyme
MNRIAEIFGSHCVLLPVVHPIGHGEAMASVQAAVSAGCKGIFLINQGMDEDEVLALVMTVRAQHPTLWVGVNLLGVPPAEVLERGLAACKGRLDGIWADNADVDEGATSQPAAQAFVDARRAHGWNGLYFGGVAFKYQREVAAENLGAAAAAALPYMDVICTSGPGTGTQADVAKVAAMRQGIGKGGAIALASGVTEANLAGYVPYVDAYLVGTGIEKDFGILDPQKVAALQSLLVRTVRAVRPPWRPPPAPVRPPPVARSSVFHTLGDPVFEHGYKNGRQVSHFLVDVTASGRDALAHALALAFAQTIGGGHKRALQVAEAGRALIFFHRAPKNLGGRPWTVRELPAPLELDGAVETAWHWLRQADYGRDEHDGGADQGWHVFNGPFGIVDEVPEAFVAVEPTWIYLPK